MAILVDKNGERFTSNDSQQIYNALKGGDYQLEDGSKLVVKDANNQAFELNPEAGNISTQLVSAFESGARFENKDEAFNRLYPSLKGVGGDLLAGAYGLVDTLAFGAPSVIAGQFDQSREFISGLREANPISTTIGEIGAFVVPGGPLAGLAKGAMKAAGSVVPAGTGIVSKGLGLAAEGAALGAVSSIPMAITEQALGSAPVSAERFLADVGTGTLIGAIANPALIGAGNLAMNSNIGKNISQIISTTLGKGSKTLSNMSDEQKVLFDKLVSNPEMHAEVRAISQQTEQEAISNVGSTLKSVDKLVNTDLQNLYKTKFNDLASNAPRSEVLSAKNEITKLLEEAELQIKKFPESYDAKYLEAISSAKKTLNLKGVDNSKIRDDLAKIVSDSPEMQSAANKTFQTAEAKAIKEVRTELGYILDKKSTQIGNNRTGTLASQLNKDITNVANRLYGEEFVSISDTYRQSKNMLKDLKKLAFDKNGEVDVSKIKSLIGSNTAKEMKLEELISKIETVSGKLGTAPNIRAEINASISDIKARRMYNQLNTGSSPGSPFQGYAISGAAGIVAGMGLGGDAGTAVGSAALLYNALKNPRQALGLINTLQKSQVKVANTINSAGRLLANHTPKIVGAANAIQTPVKVDELQKQVRTYQSVLNDPSLASKNFENTFGSLGGVAPNMSGEIQKRVFESSSFLMSKMPNMSQPDPLTGEVVIRDSVQKVREYSIYLNAVNNPLSAVKEVAQGVNVSQNRETLKMLYPNIWGQFMNSTISNLQGRSLDFSEKRLYNSILGLQDLNFTMPSVTNSILDRVVNPQPSANSIDSKESNTNRMTRDGK